MGGLSFLVVVFSAFVLGFSLCHFLHIAADIDCCECCECCCKEDDDDEDDDEDYEIEEYI